MGYSASRALPCGAMRSRTLGHVHTFAGPRLVAERGPSYDPGDRASSRRRATDRDTASDARAGHSTVEALGAAVDRVVELGFDGYSDTDLRGLLGGVQREIDRLSSVVASGAAVLQRRAAAAAAPGNEQRAQRRAQRQLAGDLNLSPGEASRVTRTGRNLQDSPQLQVAATEGRLRPQHAEVIGEFCAALGDHPDRDRLKDELVAAAASANPVELGRLARQMLADADHDAAMDGLARRRQRRRAYTTQDPDGTVRFGGQFDEVDGEVLLTALRAARHPKAPGDTRTPPQMTADAVIEICRAYLDAGHAPLDRRVAPHVMITVPHGRLESLTGSAQTQFCGPVPTGAIQTLVGNGTLRLLGTSTNGMPISLSKPTQAVSASQYLALSYRDGGCRWPGCDMPATWCDAAHGIAARDGGPASIDNLVLLCRPHHRTVDEGGWTIRIEDHGASVTFTPPGRSGGRGEGQGRGRGPGRDRDRVVRGSPPAARWHADGPDGDSDRSSDRAPP